MPTISFGPTVNSTLAAVLSTVDNALFVAVLTSFSSTQAVFTAGTTTYTASGTGLGLGLLGGQTALTSGTINSFTEVAAGVLQVSVTNFGLSALALSQAYIAEDTGTNTAALETLLLNLDWIYQGRDNADVLLASDTSGDGVPFNMAGDDVFYLARGNDNVFMGDGNDSGFGDAGQDILYGGLGRDRLYGQGSNDTLFGGIDNDRLYGGANQDWLSGDAGNDWLYGGSGDDSLVGGDGNDSLWGDTDNDLLMGGNGRDTLIGGLGNDTMDGGAGADTFVFTGASGGTDRIDGFNRLADTIVVTQVFAVSEWFDGISVQYGISDTVQIYGVTYAQYLADDSWITIA